MGRNAGGEDHDVDVARVESSGGKGPCSMSSCDEALCACRPSHHRYTTEYVQALWLEHRGQGDPRGRPRERTDDV